MAIARRDQSEGRPEIIFATVALFQAKTSSFEVIPPASETAIYVDAVVKLPQNGPFDRAVEDVLATVLDENTDELNFHDLVDLTAPSGETIHVERLPDCIHIQFGLLPGNAGSIISVLDGLLHNSAISEEEVVAAKKSLALVQPEQWANALQNERLKYDSVRSADVNGAYHRLFQPENLTITVSGPPALSGLAKAWEERTTGWTFPRAPFYRQDVMTSSITGAAPGALTTTVLRGPSVTASDATAADMLTALAMLGAGKSSTLFQVVRQKQQWSYRQEAVLRQTANGIQAAIISISEASPEDFDHAKQLRPLLLSAIDGWTKEDLDRSLKLLQASLDRGVGLNQIYFEGSHSLSPAPWDQLFIANYWRMKTGHDWSTEEVIANAQKLTLDEVKKTAHDLVDLANLEMIVGRDPKE